MVKAQKVGVEAIFETKKFQKGLQLYLDGLKKADTATSKTGQVSGVAGGALASNLAPGMASAGMSATLMAGAIAGAAAAIGIKLLNAIGNAVSGLINFEKQAILTAARVDELTIVSQLLGQRAGFTADEVERETQKIRDFGIRTDVALSLVAQFSRRQLDMADASKIARIAQDAAVLSMQDSSDALDKIMLGILTYNKRILRTSGLMVDIRGEFALMAESLDISTEALTEQQKIQAAMNGVMKEGAAIAGVYAAAMGTPGKQLRSLKRDVFDLSNALGQPFQQAFAIVIKATRGMVQAITEALSSPKELAASLGEVQQEGGKLYNLMINLGAAASLMADGFRWAADVLVNWLVGGLEDMNTAMETTAKKAFTWGINIAVELADGLIQGAVGALTWAMNQITALFSYWLSGASPPKALPDLPKWGANAMTEFLKGFTSADFGALKAIQAPLQKALSILMQTGKIGKKAGGKLLASISTELAKALSGQGKLDSKFFEKLTRAVGPFGKEIANLTRKILALAIAEEQIEKARKKEDAATKKVRAGIEEYNRLLRSGVSEQALDTKLALINAHEAEAQAARKERSEAEENLDILKEAVKLQQQLVDQILMLTQAQIIPDLASSTDGLGKGLAGSISDALSNIDMAGFQSKITDAVNEAKNKLLKLFEPVIKKWTEDWAPLFAELKKQIDLFEIKFLTVWFKLFGAERGIIPTALKKLNFTELDEAWAGLAIAFKELVVVFGELVGIDTSGVSDFFDIIRFFMSDLVIPHLQKQIDDLTESLDNWRITFEAIQDVLAFLREADPLGMNALDMNGGIGKLLIGKQLQEAGGPKTEEAVKKLGRWLGNINTKSGEVETSTGKMREAQGLWRISLGTTITAAIATFLIGAMTNLSTAFGSEGSLYQNITDMKDTLFPALSLGIDTVSLALDGLISKLGELVTAMAAVDWANLDEVIEHSPPPLASGLEQSRKQLEEFINLLPKMTANLTMPNIAGTQTPFNMMPSPTMAATPVIAGGRTQNISLTFETIINNDLDLAKFEDRVSRIVINLLT